MKKTILKISAVVVLITGLSFGAFSQTFEGVIEFKKASTIDTTSYVYYVKGENVKIDEIGTKSRRVEGTFFGSVEEDIPVGATPLIKKFTEGSFSLPLP